MKAINPYLNFDGKAREAMTFYAGCLGAELSVQSFSDAGMDAAPGTEDRTIHARLSRGDAVLMASDTQPGMPYTQGNTVFVSVECDSLDEIERVFKAFSDGAQVLMELQDTFWGARFGMLTDRYGVGWMFNYTLPKTA